MPAEDQYKCKDNSPLSFKITVNVLASAKDKWKKKKKEGMWNEKEKNKTVIYILLSHALVFLYLNSNCLDLVVSQVFGFNCFISFGKFSATTTSYLLLLYVLCLHFLHFIKCMYFCKFLHFNAFSCSVSSFSPTVL